MSSDLPPALFYHSLSEGLDRKAYQIVTEEGTEVGQVEGSISRFGEFTSVVKIVNDEYKNRGCGFQAFKYVFDELNVIVPITTIIGSWHKEDEFKDFEDGMSTNLKVFLECIRKTSDKQKCAFSTPTCKWALRLGFTKCTIKSSFTDSVTVEFTK